PRIAPLRPARPKRGPRPAPSACRAAKRAREKRFQILIAGKPDLRRVRGIGRPVGEFAIEALLRPLCSAGIDFARIEPPAFLLVPEQVIGSRDFLELLLRRLVARMQIGVKLARQFLERVLNLLVGRGSGHAEDLVWVFHAPDPIITGTTTSVIPRVQDDTANMA